jgi:hypothetical protein
MNEDTQTQRYTVQYSTRYLIAFFKFCLGKVSYRIGQASLLRSEAEFLDVIKSFPPCYSQ